MGSRGMTESDGRTIPRLLLTRIDLRRITNSIRVQQPHGRRRWPPSIIRYTSVLYLNNSGRVHVCWRRSVEEEGDKEEAEGKTLAAEDERQEVSTHRPVVVGEARPLLTQTWLLLPGKACTVNQRSEQHRRWNHTYGINNNQPQHQPTDVNTDWSTDR